MQNTKGLGSVMGSELYLEKLKNRCIASILTKKEREIDRHVSIETSDKFRSFILDEINVYHQTVIEVMRDKINPDFMEKLEVIYEYVTEEDYDNGD